MENRCNDCGPLGPQLNTAFTRQLKPVSLCQNTLSHLQGPAVREDISVFLCKTTKPSSLQGATMYNGLCMLVILLVLLLYVFYLHFFACCWGLAEKSQITHPHKCRNIQYPQDNQEGKVIGDICCHCQYLRARRSQRCACVCTSDED